MQSDREAPTRDDYGTKWVLADVTVLPDVFEKVLKAKRLFASGEAESASKAAQMAGISRSAFYKYKDAVYAYEEDQVGRVMTVHLLLQDRPGVLSSVLSAFAEAGANILTINQNIPADGLATVSVSAKGDRLVMSVDDFLDFLKNLHGVEKITRVAI